MAPEFDGAVRRWWRCGGLRTMCPEPTPIHPKIRAACDDLLGRVDELADAMATLIRREEPYYRDAMSLRELADLSGPNIIGILRALVGEAGVDPGPARETGRVRAEQGVPLSIVHRAYRLG